VIYYALCIWSTGYEILLAATKRNWVTSLGIYSDDKVGLNVLDDEVDLQCQDTLYFVSLC
jgi:hypothetical protein